VLEHAPPAGGSDNSASPPPRASAEWQAHATEQQGASSLDSSADSGAMLVLFVKPTSADVSLQNLLFTSVELAAFALSIDYLPSSVRAASAMTAAAHAASVATCGPRCRGSCGLRGMCPWHMHHMCVISRIHSSIDSAVHEMQASPAQALTP
jgi:hypothetical protein